MALGYHVNRVCAIVLKSQMCSEVLRFPPAGIEGSEAPIAPNSGGCSQIEVGANQVWGCLYEHPSGDKEVGGGGGERWRDDASGTRENECPTPQTARPVRPTCLPDPPGTRITTGTPSLHHRGSTGDHPWPIRGTEENGGGGGGGGRGSPLGTGTLPWPGSICWPFRGRRRRTQDATGTPPGHQDTTGTAL